MFPLPRAALFFGLFLLISQHSFAASPSFCKTYAKAAVQQFAMMRQSPGYDCHPNPEFMPLWTADPRDHYNWCTHKAISQYIVSRELERRTIFLQERCHYKPFMEKSG